jgi:3-oxoacyl-[acyl-carrier protein] reductase
MKEMGGGHIVNIASLAGVGAIPGIAVYSASKFAVRGFSLAAGFELKRYGIAVTVLCPHAVRTPLLKQSSEHAAGAVVFSSGRLLTVEEVGAVVLNRVLTRKEPEVAIPFHWAWIAKLANLAPALGAAIIAPLLKKGREHQSKTDTPASEDANGSG